MIEVAELVVQVDRGIVSLVQCDGEVAGVFVHAVGVVLEFLHSNRVREGNEDDSHNQKEETEDSEEDDSGVEGGHRLPRPHDLLLEGVGEPPLIPLWLRLSLVHIINNEAISSPYKRSCCCGPALQTDLSPCRLGTSDWRRCAAAA